MKILVATQNLNYGRQVLIKGQRFKAKDGDAKVLVLIGKAKEFPRVEKEILQSPMNRAMQAVNPTNEQKRPRGRPRKNPADATKTTYKTKGSTKK